MQYPYFSKNLPPFSLRLILLAFLLSGLACQKKALVTAQELNTGWQFHEADSTNWMNAQVPGCVHTDLLRLGIIEDPFYRLNEHDVQWIDKKDWVYQTTFSVSKEMFKKDRISLNFKGLDTHADVYVNGEKLLEADNMFRGWEVDVKSAVKEGDNELKIYFHSPIKVGMEKYQNYPHEVHSSANDLAEIGQVPDSMRVSVHIRKAQCHFGWDWGPRLVPSGIWQPVYLQAWNEARITDVQMVQESLKADTAVLHAAFEVEAEREMEGTLEVWVNGEIRAKVKKQLTAGLGKYLVTFHIPNPKRWWSNGLGEAHMYQVITELTTDGGFDRKTQNIGLRELEVVREKDKFGTSWYVKLNGHPVFMKGANFIPADAFLDRVSPEKYEQIILTAKNANHNMLRVWGGGIYEKDIFYDLCDKHGILVWQDFMFACNMYPGHPEFLESVRQEAIYNIKRLRNHPSLALWCGNNEVLAAWLRWGWKEEVEATDSLGAIAQWQAYKDIFLDVLPSAVKAHDPNRFYWASSPQSGDTIPVDFVNGDDHYWGVWWGQEPFENYHTKLSRFMSEYGFQSFPELKSVQKYATEEDWDIFSDVMKSHQRSSIGNGTIANYMERDYREPKDFPSFLYVGQVLQAAGIKQAMEGHRIAMPFNMGSLYWQINDCWPVASWSSSDYYLRWKAMQYFSQKAFAEVLVAVRDEAEGDSIMVYGVSDRLTDIPAELDLTMLSFQGDTLWQMIQPITLAANSSQKLFEQRRKDLLKRVNEKKAVLSARIRANGKVLSENTYYFLPVKDLKLPEVEVKTVVSAKDGGFSIKLTSDLLAKNVFLSSEKSDGFFSDNYFDLLPGEVKTVTFTPATPADSSLSDLKIITIRDSY